MFSSKSFIVSGLTCRSLIHFEFIFVCSIRKSSNFILLHVAVQFSQHNLWRRLSFLHGICLLPLSKPMCSHVCRFIFGLSTLFHWYIFLFFLSIPYHLDDCNCVAQSEDRRIDSSSSILHSQDCFGYSGSFVFPYSKFIHFLA